MKQLKGMLMHSFFFVYIKERMSSDTLSSLSIDYKELSVHAHEEFLVVARMFQLILQEVHSFYRIHI